MDKTNQIKLNPVFKVIIGIVFYVAVSFILITFFIIELPKLEVQVFTEKAILHTFSLFALILQTIIWTGILFIPGYLFSKALFLEIPLMERILISFALSALLSFFIDTFFWFSFWINFLVVHQQDFHLALCSAFEAAGKNEGNFSIGGALFLSILGFFWWKIKLRKTKILKNYNPPATSSHPHQNLVGGGPQKRKQYDKFI